MVERLTEPGCRAGGKRTQDVEEQGRDDSESHVRQRPRDGDQGHISTRV